MPLSTCTLIKKIKLTDEVFELHYDIGEEKIMKAGQFMTFILPKIGGRSYSILELEKNIAVLIIKKWELQDGGRGGSIKLCEANIGETFSYVGPAGHFVLQDTECHKLFLATGTGFVPLYNQIIFGLKNNPQKNKYQLVFGVRYEKDFFCIDRLKKLKEIYPDTFYYHLFASREDTIKQKTPLHIGYVTDFLGNKIAQNYQEFYICGAPAMIESCEEKLKNLGVSSEQIFFEKYS